MGAEETRKKVRETVTIQVRSDSRLEGRRSDGEGVPTVQVGPFCGRRGTTGGLDPGRLNTEWLKRLNGDMGAGVVRVGCPRTEGSRRLGRRRIGDPRSGRWTEFVVGVSGSGSGSDRFSGSG